MELNWRTVMRGAAVLVLAGAVVLAGCGGDDDAADTGAASTTVPGGKAIVIRTKIAVAAISGSKPIATGDVLEGSTLGDSPVCAGGTILDSHASRHPDVKPYGLIARTITCPDGTVRLGFTPGPTQNLSQTGTWTIVSGTGAFERLRGSGEMKTRYDPDDPELARETLTGTATP
jgi:hypothetical protein